MVDTEEQGPQNQFVDGGEQADVMCKGDGRVRISLCQHFVSLWLIALMSTEK